MDDDEAADLLQYIRTSARQRGLADLDRLTLNADTLDGADGVGRMTAYLRALRDQMRLGSERTSRNLMASFDGVRTSDGRAITGIQVDLTDGDAQLYGVDRIDLVGSAELDAWLESLDELIEELEESRD